MIQRSRNKENMIADFRTDNGNPFRDTCRRFIVLWPTASTRSAKSLRLAPTVSSRSTASQNVTYPKLSSTLSGWRMA